MMALVLLVPPRLLEEAALGITLTLDVELDEAPPEGTPPAAPVKPSTAITRPKTGR